MEVLEFPPIETVAATVPALPTASLKAAALAHFTAIEPNIRALAEKYRAVAYDVATTKGMDAAKKARLDLRENGRYAVQRAEKAVKDEVNDLKRVIAPKVESLIAILQPVEDHVHGQITAQEEKLAAEKAERERIEAERKAKHEAGIATIRGYVAAAQGKTSAQIESGRNRMLGIMIGEDWQEYREQAEAALAETLATLQAMHDTTKAAEDAAAAAEAQRIEQSRVAAEQAAEATRLAEVAAELQHQQRAEAERLEAERAELARQRAELEALRNPPPAVKPEPEPVVEVRAAVEKPVITVDLDNTPPTEIPAPLPAPTLKLGTIGTRLGFTVTADFLRSLGFEPAGRERSAVMYQESDFARICDALIAHINTVKEL